MSLEKQYDDWVRGLMGVARAPSEEESRTARDLSLIHISEPTRP